MILLLPFAALSGAVLADAARTGIHKKLPTHRSYVVNHLTMMAEEHGRKHGMSISRIAVSP